MISWSVLALCCFKSHGFQPNLAGSSAFLSSAFHKQQPQQQRLGWLKSTVSPDSASASSSPYVATASSNNPDVIRLQTQVQQLKKVLAKEYASFFNPMEREYYSPSVTFDDPLTSLSGVDSYQTNVDLLASRTLLGKFLFQDAGIVLHSITGGNVTTTKKNNEMVLSDLITRWTLRMTIKVLPWQPTARFTGISVYQIQPGGPKGVQILHQTDYWDSINLQQGTYQSVEKSIAVQDFLQQLRPAQFGMAPAAVEQELPYQLLRRGADYEVRRYPSFIALQTTYQRRDEAFSELGTLTTGEYGACEWLFWSHLYSSCQFAFLTRPPLPLTLL